MNRQETLLVGKVLQIRDKLIAKRHNIPSNLQDDWQNLTRQTECFDSNCLYSHAVKGESAKKPALFSGSVKELQTLLHDLEVLNDEVIYAQVRH